MDTFDHLWEQAELNRRELIAAGATTGFVAGFAMSAQPVEAQTMIVTGTAGIDAAMGEFPTSTGPIPAYRALPAGAKSRPLILVVQEIFGLHEHIKDVCRRLAKLGYCAVAPSLYHRQGDVTKLASIDDIRPIVAKVPDAQVLADLDAARAWAVKSGWADDSKVGITGFCWGGRIVWLYAAHSPSLRARRRLVRPPHRRQDGEQPCPPGRPGHQDQGAGARALRRPGRRHCSLGNF